MLKTIFFSKKKIFFTAKNLNDNLFFQKYFLNAPIFFSDTPSFIITREPDFGIPIREGMPVSLKCDVDANPKSSPVWQKDDTDVPVLQTPDGYLNFTEILREHSGWYKCVSRHLLGKFSSIGYFLNVRCKFPKVVEQCSLWATIVNVTSSVAMSVLVHCGLWDLQNRPRSHFATTHALTPLYSVHLLESRSLTMYITTNFQQIYKMQ